VCWEGDHLGIAPLIFTSSAVAAEMIGIGYNLSEGKIEVWSIDPSTGRAILRSQFVFDDGG